MKWFLIISALLLVIHIDSSLSNDICLVELVATPYIASVNNETDGPDHIGFNLAVCRLEGMKVQEVINCITLTNKFNLYV